MEIVKSQFTTVIFLFRRRRAAGNNGRTSSRRSRSSARSRSSGGTRRQGGRRASSRSPSRRSSRATSRSRRGGGDVVSQEQEARKSQIGVWPHGQSFLFSCLGVMLGMFSINRIVILTIDFGGDISHQSPPLLMVYFSRVCGPVSIVVIVLWNPSPHLLHILWSISGIWTH